MILFLYHLNLFLRIIQDPLEDNLSDISILIDEVFADFVERTVAYMLFYAKEFKEFYETLEIAITKILTIAGAVYIKSPKGKNST